MLKVLVVDDEVDISLLFRHKFKNELKSGAIDLYFSQSGPEALGFLENETNPEIDLILTDINMPGMSGLDLTKMLKANYPDKLVYIITAYAESLNYEIGREYGADEFLTKPLEFSILREKMTNLYSRYIH